MDNFFTKAYAADDFRRFGHQLIDLLGDYLETTQTDEVPQTINWDSPGNQLKYWEDDFETPLLDEPGALFRNLLDKSIHLHSRGAMGHQVSAPLPAAILASFLSSFLNNGLAVYEMGMAGNAIEKVVIGHLAKKLGFDKKASGLVTSGGTLGNLTALLAARAAATTAWNDGSLQGQQLAVMVSEEAHYSVDRAVRIMGLGSEGIIKVPANEKFQMRCELLDGLLNEAKQRGKKVFCIVGSACSTSTGAYDDLEAIAAFAAKHQIWFHTDGAHGAPAIYSPGYKYLLKGVEHADSVTIDFHKMMLTPALSTALIFKQGSNAYQTFAQKAQYLWEGQDSGEWYNSGKVTFECTKTMNVVSVYTLMRMYGDELFKQNIETLYGLASKFAALIASKDDFELACLPQSNIVCFRYIKGDDLDTANKQILKNLLDDGRFYIVSTALNGKFYLRTTLMNPLTTYDNLVDLLNIIKST